MKPNFKLLAASMVFSLCSIAVFAQNNADVEAINAVIDKYCETESANDMNAQAALMSDDRIWIGGGGQGRVTDQKKNMEMQQMNWEEGEKFLPGVKWNFDARDRIIRTYGDGSTAVASFYWYSSYVLPGDAPMEKAKLFGANEPSIITLVLEKTGDNWKIVHTHVSMMN